LSFPLPLPLLASLVGAFEEEDEEDDADDDDEEEDASCFVSL